MATSSHFAEDGKRQDAVSGPSASCFRISEKSCSGGDKRFITGKGNTDKAAVIAAVQAKGFAPADDNEADAIAILLWAIETRGGVR